MDKIDYTSCIALIPARGGSKSVPKKNIRVFKGFPMIAYAIAAAKLSKKIERVIVSTDSEEIAEIAKKYGAEVPFLRPIEYAQDKSPDIDFVRHAIQWMREHEEKIPEYIVHMRVTTPIRDFRVVDQGIETIMKDTQASSLRSGHLCTHPPYKWFQFAETGYLKPLMQGLTCDEANRARQDFPDVFVPNGYVDVLKADFIIENNLMHGNKMLGFITGEVLDIDTEEDLYKLEICEGKKEAFYELHKYLLNSSGGNK